MAVWKKNISNIPNISNDEVAVWKKDIDAKCGQIPSLLLGNKVRISPTKYKYKYTKYKTQIKKYETQNT